MAIRAEPIRVEQGPPPRRPRRSPWTWRIVAAAGLGLACLAIALYMWVPALSPLHYGGDPGGTILSSLRSQVTTALPSDAKVTSTSATEPKWLASGCDGSSGWTVPRFNLVFTSQEVPAVVIEGIDRSLQANGWIQFDGHGYGGIDQIWTRGSSSVATMTLASRQPGLPSGTWRLGGYLPPRGQLVQTC